MPKIKSLSINSINKSERDKLITGIRRSRKKVYEQYKDGLDALLKLQNIIDEYTTVNKIGGYKTMQPAVVKDIKNLYQDVRTGLNGFITAFSKDKTQGVVNKLNLYLKYINNDIQRLDNMNPEDKISLPLAVYKCDQEKKSNSAVKGGDKKPSFEEYIRVYSLNLPKGEVAYNFTEETVLAEQLGEEFGKKCREYIERVLEDYVKYSPDKLRLRYEKMVRSNPRTYEYEEPGEYDKYNHIDFKIRNTGDTNVINNYLVENAENLSFPEMVRLEKRIESLKKIESLNKDIETKMSNGEDYVKYPKIKEKYKTNEYDIEIVIPQDNYQTSGNGCWSCSSLMMIKSRGINNVTQEDIRAYRPKIADDEQIIDNHNMGQFDAEVHNIDNYNKDEAKGILEMGDAILSFAPNNMLREVTINPLSLEDFTENDVTKGEYVNNIVNFMEKQIIHSIKEDKSPLSLNVANHYITIVGIAKRNGRLFMKYKNSLAGSGGSPDKVYEVDLRNYIDKVFYKGEMPANYRGITLTWMSKIELAKDGHTIHGIPSEYVYMKDDGTINLQPEDYRVVADGEKCDTNREGIRIYRTSGNEESVVDNKISKFTRDGLKTTERVYIKPKLNAAFLKNMAAKRTDEEEKRLYNFDKEYYDLKGDKRAKDDPDARKAIEEYHKKYGVKNAIKVNTDLKKTLPAFEKIKDNKKRYVDDSILKTDKKYTGKAFAKQLKFAKEQIKEEKKRQLEEQIEFNKTNQTKKHKARIKEEIKRVRPIKFSVNELSGDGFIEKATDSFERQKTSLDKMMFVLDAMSAQSVFHGVISPSLIITDQAKAHKKFTSEEIGALIVNNKNAIEAMSNDIENLVFNNWVRDITNIPQKEFYMLVGMIGAKLSKDMVEERKKMLNNRELFRDEPNREEKIDYILKKRDSLYVRAAKVQLDSLKTYYHSEMVNLFEVAVEKGVDDTGHIPDYVVNPELLKNMTVGDYLNKLGIDKSRMDKLVKLKTGIDKKSDVDSNAYEFFKDIFVSAYEPTHAGDNIYNLSVKGFNSKFAWFMYDYLYYDQVVDQARDTGEQMYLSTLSEAERQVIPKGKELLDDNARYPNSINDWRKSKDADIHIGQYRVEDANKIAEKVMSQTYTDKTLDLTVSKESEYSKCYTKPISTKKTFDNYIKLHSGFEAAKGSSDEVIDNIAKCFAAVEMKHAKKEFDVKSIRKSANKIKNSITFKKLDIGQINKAFRDSKYLDDLSYRVDRGEELIKSLIDALSEHNKDLKASAIAEDNPDKMIDGTKGTLDADKAALNYVTKQYLVEAKRADVGIKKLKSIIESVKKGEFKKKVDKLANNSTFRMVVKDNPKNYYSVWNKGNENLKDCVKVWKDNTSSVEDAIDFIKDGADINMQYSRLADYVLKAILTEPRNERVAMAIVTDKLLYRDALSATTNKLKQMKTLDYDVNNPTDWDSVKKIMADGTLADNVAESLMDIANQPAKNEPKKSAVKKTTKNANRGIGPM